MQNPSNKKCWQPCSYGIRFSRPSSASRLYLSKVVELNCGDSRDRETTSWIALIDNCSTAAGDECKKHRIKRFASKVCVIFTFSVKALNCVKIQIQYSINVYQSANVYSSRCLTSPFNVLTWTQPKWITVAQFRRINLASPKVFYSSKKIWRIFGANLYFVRDRRGLIYFAARRDSKAPLFLLIIRGSCYPAGFSTPVLSSRHPFHGDASSSTAPSNANTPPSNSVSRLAKIISNYVPTSPTSHPVDQPTVHPKNFRPSQPSYLPPCAPVIFLDGTRHGPFAIIIGFCISQWWIYYIRLK